MVKPKVLFAAALISGLMAVSARGDVARGGPTNPDIGRFEITTLPFDKRLVLRSGTYTPSGKVLATYASSEVHSSREISLATLDDDGRNFRPFFAGTIPERAKDNGIRMMIFPDNKRIFLGDFILECDQPLEACEKPALLPVDYPREVAGGDHISHRWSEIIVAPDNRSIAWTTLLADYSSVAFIGRLQKQGARYKIVDARIVSTLEPFVKDLRHPDGVLPQLVRGGEVKQFVHGGTAISLAGALKRDVPDSTVQDLASGAIDAVTDTPGYTETTIFSPDERLGITMTTRFSPRTDPAILGLMPRPYPVSLNMGLSMLAYTYAVTGVRDSRPGNVGPALIDIGKSMSDEGYTGVNLNTQDDWVFHSPLSWHPSGRKALWSERRRGTTATRVQIVHLVDYRPGKSVAAQPTPLTVPYGSTDLSQVQALSRGGRTIDVKVYGRHAGYITYRKQDSRIEKRYVGFSDDGLRTYSGLERFEGVPAGRSTFSADVRLAGSTPGIMKLRMTWGPLNGRPQAALLFERDASGTAMTQGFVEYGGKRLNAADLLP